MKAQRHFKGIWIPAAVWLDKTITPTEKFLLAEIQSYDDGRGCPASNAELAKPFQSTPASIAVMVTKLVKAKKLVRISSRPRLIRCAVDMVQDRKEQPQRPKVAVSEPELIYRMYPRKVAKPKAIAAIKKAIKSEGYDDIERATQLFAALWDGVSAKDKTFCPHPATWFSQERYNDEPDTWTRPEVDASTQRKAPATGDATWSKEKFEQDQTKNQNNDE